MNGTDPETLISGATVADSYDLDLDLVNGKMYWGNTASEVRWADLDGQNDLGILTLTMSPDSLALDVVGGKIYWSENGPGEGIYRADLDGQNEELFRLLTLTPGGIALDLVNSPQRLYYAEYDTGDSRIFREDLDKSNNTEVEDVFAAAGKDLSYGLALDVLGNKMYMGLGGAGTIGSADIPDGGNFAEYTDPALNTDIDLDLGAGKYYYGVLAAIQRANLDGTGPETAFPLVAGEQPYGIALQCSSCGNSLCEYEEEKCSADCSSETHCNDGVDNDDDGAVDGADSDCPGVPENTDALCGDSLDNDSDGLVDCADPDCNTHLGPGGTFTCEFGTELTCGDSGDNDADGLTDCADASDCPPGIPPC